MSPIGRTRAFKRSLVEGRRRREIDAILSNPAAPDTSAAERDFDALQAAYAPLPEYGYDGVSLMRRASQRLADILADMPANDGKLRFLDIGAGDGTLGALFAACGHDVTLCDLRDWRKPLAAGLTFVEADVCQGLPLPTDSFDIVTSFNAFEHMADPGAALAEMIRVTAPGGRIHLDFGPLYNSPWGLHAYRSLRMPYPQLLFSSALIEAKLAALGISDLGEGRTELQFVNGWQPARYEQLWHNQPDAKLLSSSRHLVPDFLKLVKRYPASFRGRGLLYDDVITANLKVLLQKQKEGSAATHPTSRGR